METILLCHPKDLPKLEDKTVLTLPIHISIAITTKPVKIWQSDGFLTMVVCFIILLGLSTIGGMAWAILIWAFLMVWQNLNDFNVTKRFQVPSKRFAQEFNWQKIDILTIFTDKVIWFDTLKNQTQTIDYANVKKFKVDRFQLGAFRTKTLTNLKDTEIYLNSKILILNDLYRINQLEVADLLEKVRENHQPIVTFKRFKIPFDE